MEIHLSKNDEFEKYSYLINYEVVFGFYVKIIQLIGISFILLVLSHAVVNSSTGLISFNNIEVSGYYLLPLVLIIFVFLESIYSFFNDKKKVVVSLNLDDGLKIKLKWGPIIEIDRFTLILNKRKLKFESQIPGLKPYKKYDYDYVGIQHNETIYVIPYAEGRREELIGLLETANHLKPTPKIY